MTPAKLVASLPPFIRVGPYDIGIHVRTMEHQRDAGHHGTFSAGRLQIEMEPDAPSCVFMADTFWHEVNHAIYYVMGIKDEDDEERTVSTLTTGQVQVLQANPWLLKWLTKALA
jgi:hypothetical protein